MTPLAFEELDWQPTALGTLSLRRRRLPGATEDVFEVKLGDEFLMTSRFTASEVALAEIGLAPLAGTRSEVVVGGLGLGHTAAAVLADPRVAALWVVEAVAPVVRWHETGLVPLGPTLAGDPRCRFVEADFFALAASPEGFDPAAPGRRVDAVLLDIDHAPGHWLRPQHAAFYALAGLLALKRHLRPGGVFALWSNEPPESAFLDRLGAAFTDCVAVPVRFADISGREVVQTVYRGRCEG